MHMLLYAGLGRPKTGAGDEAEVTPSGAGRLAVAFVAILAFAIAMDTVAQSVDAAADENLLAQAGPELDAKP